MLSPLLRSRPFIICADGGANKVRSFGITPDCIIGDLDSITNATRRYYASVPVIHVARQDSTDLEKALDYLLEQRFRSAAVVGATGDRPDHTMGNFSILVKYHKKILLQFIDERCEISVIQKKIRFKTFAGQKISLVPMGKCSGVTTSGLKYPLHNEPLEPGVREGTSNEAFARTAAVSVRQGNLLLFRMRDSV